jgi:hypothetical protein
MMSQKIHPCVNKNLKESPIVMSTSASGYRFTPYIGTWPDAQQLWDGLDQDGFGLGWHTIIKARNMNPGFVST